MKKPRTVEPKYVARELEGEMPFKMYSAAPGQQGGGHLVFHETWVDVIPQPEVEWIQQNKAKRKVSNRLKASDGTWNVWFLLARAFVYSRDAISKTKKELNPTDDEAKAYEQMQTAAKAQARATDARVHVSLIAAEMGNYELLEVAATDQVFVDWYQNQMRSHEGNRDLIEAIDGYERAAERLLSGLPKDVLCFIRALRDQAWLAGMPPAKGDVRVAMGMEMQDEVINRRSDVMCPDISKSVAGGNIVRFDIVDRNTFTRLLKRTGFGWIPNRKPGPNQQTRMGKKGYGEFFQYIDP